MTQQARKSDSSYSRYSTLLDRYAGWYQATKREADVEAQIRGAAIKLFSGEVTTTFDPGIREHVFEEVDSDLLFKVRYRMKFVSPVFFNKQLSGLIAVSDCKLIGSRGAAL